MNSKKAAMNAAAVATGLVMLAAGASSASGSGDANPKAGAAIVKISPSMLMQAGLAYEKGSALPAFGDDKKKAEGGKDVNSGPGKGTTQVGFFSPSGQHLLYMVPDNVVKSTLNEPSGKFGDSWASSKMDISVKTKEGELRAFEVTQMVKADAAMLIFVDKSDSAAKDAKVFYIGGPGFEFYQDRNGIALSIGDHGIMYVSAKGQVSGYRYTADLLDFRTYSMLADLYKLRDKKGRAYNPDLSLINQENAMGVNGTAYLKKGAISDTLALLTISGKERIDSAAMTCVNPNGQYDPKRLDLSVVPATNEYYVGHVHYEYPQGMMSKVFGSSEFTGHETIARVDTKDTTNRQLGIVMGKTDMQVLIGTGGNGMAYNWTMLDTKAGSQEKEGIAYKVTDGQVVKLGGDKYAYGHKPIGKGGMLYALAVEDGEMLVKVLFTDAIGKPYKLLVANTNIAPGTKIEDFSGAYDSKAGIAFKVKMPGGEETILKISNDTMPRLIRDEDAIYNSNYSMLGLPTNDLGSIGIQKYGASRNGSVHGVPVNARGFAKVNRAFANRRT